MGVWSDIKSWVRQRLTHSEISNHAEMGNCCGKQEPEHDPIPSQLASESRITSTNVLLEEKREAKGPLYGSAASALDQASFKRPNHVHRSEVSHTEFLTSNGSSRTQLDHTSKKSKRPPAAAVTRQYNSESASSVNLGTAPISASDSTFTSISDSKGARFTLSDVPILNRPSQPFVCMHLSGLAMQAALYKNIGVQQLSLSSYSDNSNAPTWMMAEWMRSEKAKFNMTFGARAAHMVDNQALMN